MRPSLFAAAPTATMAPGLPRRLQYICSLPHGEVVCAVTLGPAPAGRSAITDDQPPDNLEVAASNGCSDLDTAGANSPSVQSPPTPVRPGSAVTSNGGYFAYTGGRGCVKLWDLGSMYHSSNNNGPGAFVGNSVAGSPFSSSGGSMKHESFPPIVTFDCLNKDAYVRSIKLMPDATGLVIGGESNALTVWDLNGPGRRKADLRFDTLACYALALSPDGKLCYSCYSDGDVAVWDWHNQCVVSKFSAHADGASCIEMMPDGQRLWTGGLDLNVRCWDLRASQAEELHRVPFRSQVFTLGVWQPPKQNRERSNGRHESEASSPSDEMTRKEMELDEASDDSGKRAPRFAETSEYWLAVGLESSEVEVMAVGADGPARPAPMMPPSAFLAPPASIPVVEEFNTPQPLPQHFRLTRHESCVLALKFAHRADWFLTTGKDHQVNAWRAPFGTCLLETKEAASVLTCDISHDDKFVVTGSGDKKANLYEVVYASTL
ncbi:hypothetical protein Ciccas_005130 [Cichlidogyrus casuarinus]|uniref:Guanine nucleotide-binding protein subunit beta-like protein n=1 Tax=Cichlidogyrus casuarinus TaxID=1844966 RepID=A0ABD2Q9I6_9PLAT